MSIYQHANGELAGSQHGVHLNDLNFDDLYLEYDDIDATMQHEMELEETEDDFTEQPNVMEQLSLTTQQIDLLSVELGRSWKRFARVAKLLDAEIEDLEHSYKSMYERCYQMLILWGRKSRYAIKVPMVNTILTYIQRNDLVRKLKGELISTPSIKDPSMSPSMENLSFGANWNWKEFARQTRAFTEIEIANVDEEERYEEEKFSKILLHWQEKSQFSITIDDVKHNLTKMKNVMAEKNIRYTVDNGDDIRKIKIRAHHGLEDLNKELLFIDKHLFLQKVQYIDCHHGDIITCDNETQLDLAVFEENITDFNVVTKRKWWILFQPNVRTRT